MKGLQITLCGAVVVWFLVCLKVLISFLVVLSNKTRTQIKE